jgi:putative hydrolase of the HAD superfamily
VINLYIFDEGGVMIRGHAVMPEAAAALGVEPEALRAAIEADLRELSDGRIGSMELWRRFEARTGIRPGRDYLRECFKPTRDEATFELVTELRSGARALGARVVCGTNTIDSHHEINIGLGMYEPFDAVYASHLIHRSKPDPEFWLAILKAEGVPPDRAFFADDSPANVEAARALGLRSSLYTGAAALRRDLAELGAPIAS